MFLTCWFFIEWQILCIFSVTFSFFLSSFFLFIRSYLHMGQSIQEWTKCNLWKTTFKKIEVIWSACLKYSWKKNTEGLYKWDKVFKDGPSEIRGRQLLKNLKWYGLLLKNLKWYGSMWSDMVVIWSDMVVIDMIWNDITSNFLKAVFRKLYLVHSWTLCPICK